MKAENYCIVAIIILLFFLKTLFGENVRYFYDQLNRLEQIKYSNSTSIIFSYDEVGNRTSMLITQSTQQGIYVSIKIYLQGPYNKMTNSMATSLKEQDKLPLSQPYNKPPWNYNGNENVNNIPDGVVDWVLVELRSGQDADSKVSNRAAFLRKDGMITDTDGVSPVFFANIQAGNYFLVVRHRNHLAVMSKISHTLSEQSNPYDFTNSQSKAYGENPMQELETDTYGMRSGDGNSDGIVNEADRTDVWRPQNGTKWNYNKYGDYNLDGGIDALDLNLHWRVNNGFSSQVPESSKKVTKKQQFPKQPKEKKILKLK